MPGRTVTVWQAWCDCDPADTDSFHTTKPEAEAWAASHECCAEVEREPDVDIRPITVRLTRAGICESLASDPHR